MKQILQTLPVLVIIMLSLCLSPIPKTYVATQYPAHDLVKLDIASSSLKFNQNYLLPEGHHKLVSR